MAGIRVAVVGGGCSGVLATVSLLWRTDATVVLVEPGEPGGGVAYGAARPWHVLNSRAGAMSADPDDPGHFARWAGAEPHEFAPRAVYGRYLRTVLEEAVTSHPGRFEHVRARAATARPGAVVVLEDGGEVRADHVVLAVGNLIGAPPAGIGGPVSGHPAYVGDPWRPGAVEALPTDRPVLLVGTGLTAIDVALTLTAAGPGPAQSSRHAGNRDTRAAASPTPALGGPDVRPGVRQFPAAVHSTGSPRWRTAPVFAVSRRGLLPLTHTALAAPVVKPALDDCASLREVIRAVRETAGEAGDWRAVVDGLRPDLDRLWGALTPAERGAFLRHLARPWECHRHRMAPEVSDRVVGLRRDDVLRVRDGGFRRIEPARDGFVVELASETLAVGGIVNCAGPGLLPAAADPLTRSLLRNGTASVGPHRLGLGIDHSGRLVGADGRTHQDLWVLGPLRRGARWETTAVPEIREQARRLADDVSAPALKAAA